MGLARALGNLARVGASWRGAIVVGAKCDQCTAVVMVGGGTICSGEGGAELLPAVLGCSRVRISPVNVHRIVTCGFPFGLESTCSSAKGKKLFRQAVQTRTR